MRDLSLRGAGPGGEKWIGLEIVNEACDHPKLDSVIVEKVEASVFHSAGIYVGDTVFKGQRLCARAAEPSSDAQPVKTARSIAAATRGRLASRRIT